MIWGYHTPALDSQFTARWTPKGSYIVAGTNLTYFKPLSAGRAWHQTANFFQAFDYHPDMVPVIADVVYGGSGWLAAHSSGGGAGKGSDVDGGNHTWLDGHVSWHGWGRSIYNGDRFNGAVPGWTSQTSSYFHFYANPGL